MDIFRSDWEVKKRQRFLLTNFIFIGILAVSIAASVFFAKYAGQQILDGQVVLNLVNPDLTFDFNNLLQFLATLIN